MTLTPYQLINDMLDLARFRVKPLPEYQYPLWQIMLVVTLMGIFSAAAATDIDAPVPARIGFFVMLEWVELLLMNWFFNWWMRQGDNWRGDGDLLPLFVAASGVNLLTPLLSWFTRPLVDVLAVGLSAYSVAIVIHALTLSTGVRRTHVIGGVLLFLPMAIAGYLVVATFAVQAGWISLPAK
ncbi:hypothetical protein [Chitinivorax sp. B]|uniref:hypothetical protein n=1 Tax=Chitinivorax sp. B TaxID=2502235 RepID=UPI0010F7A331|nr:hypothetical protein [Chitinivorax sp. B]